MLTGIFIENTPWIQIAVSWGISAQAPFAILDTGFSGDLQVTPEIAKELNLKITGATKATIANGKTISVPVALAIASLEGGSQYIQVLIASSTPLAGIGLFSKFGYTAVVDCKFKQVSLVKSKKVT